MNLLQQKVPLHTTAPRWKVQIRCNITLRTALKTQINKIRAVLFLLQTLFIDTCLFSLLGIMKFSRAANTARTKALSWLGSLLWIHHELQGKSCSALRVRSWWAVTRKTLLIKKSWTLLGNEGNTDLRESFPEEYKRVSGSPEEWYNCQAKILLHSRIQQRNRTGKAATALADRRSPGLAVWLQSTQICDGKLKNSPGKEAGVASSPACFITVPRPAASSSRQNHHRETAES